MKISIETVRQMLDIRAYNPETKDLIKNKIAQITLIDEKIEGLKEEQKILVRDLTLLINDEAENSKNLSFEDDPDFKKPLKLVKG